MSLTALTLIFKSNQIYMCIIRILPKHNSRVQHGSTYHTYNLT